MFPFGKKKSLLPQEEQSLVVGAIQEAEAGTTGEVRVYMESSCSYMDAMDRAVEVFQQLGMQQTTRRNAVLVYLALNDRQFAILGDEEIYTRAGGPAFWQEAADRLRQSLKDGQVTDGLCACVRALGRALAQHFPYDPAVPKNELPDDIVFGK